MCVITEKKTGFPLHYRICTGFLFILIADFGFSQQVNGTISSKIDSANFQQIEKPKRNFHLKASATITNKGISYIPNLSLGKPAIIFDLSMSRGKLSFEPQMRFSLYGEPWSFLFPIRYKIKSKGKFQLTAGVNPLFNFKSVTTTLNGVETAELVNRRYLGAELKPGFFFTENICITMVYLYFAGISERTVMNTNFVSFGPNFSKIKLGGKFFARFNPQVYYLNQDWKEGLYFNSVITLLRKDFPLSIQANMNAAIQTNIAGEKNIWNVSLIYSLNRTYVRK